MLFYFVLGILSLVFILVAYLVYINYKENVVFRGETFRESQGIKKLLDFIIPKDTRILDNKLFFIYGFKVTVRDLYLVKLLSLVVATILSFSIMYTNFLHNRLEVFESQKDFPFTITEENYRILVEDLSFQTLDYKDDMAKLSANKKRVPEPAMFVNVDNDLLYTTIGNMKHDYEHAFTFFILLSGIIIIIIGWYFPNIFVNLCFRILDSSSDYEFAELEGFIYIHANSRIEVIIDGLINESLMYKQMFRIFKRYYSRDPSTAYSRILLEKDLSINFRTLVGYLEMLETSDREKVKTKIRINQDTYKKKLKTTITTQAENKRFALTFFAYIGIGVNLLGMLIALIGSVL